MLLLALVACRPTPPPPEPPLDEPVLDDRGILAARHGLGDQRELPAPFDGALEASRDGSRFAARLTDGAVHVYDADGTTRFVVRGAPGAARVIRWADDGSRLVIGGSERLTVIDADGQRVAEWMVDDLHDAVLSPRGASLVVSAGADVTWFDAATGEGRWTSPHGGGPLVFLREHEAVAVSDGQRLRRFDRLGGLQVEVTQSGIIELEASERWIRGIDDRGQSFVRSATDLQPGDWTPWTRRLHDVVAGPDDHWFIDGRVTSRALAPESEAAFVTRDARAAVFVRIGGQLGLQVATDDRLLRWSLWRAPRVARLPLPADVRQVTHLGAAPQGPFVMGSDAGHVWAVAVDGLDRYAWRTTLPRCPADDDLGCFVLDIGGTPDRLEIATDQAAYAVEPGRDEATRVARLRRIRGALALPDGRWVSWNRDSVRVGARPGAGRRVGPPLDVPRVAVGNEHHAVIWDSAIVVRNARGQPHGERWPIPYDELPDAIAVAPDGNVVAAAFDGQVRLFFVESGFAQIVRPEVASVHGLEFSSDGLTLWAAGDGLTRIVVNQAEAVERWSLARGPRVDSTTVHPDLGRVAALQHGPDGPSVTILPPR
ncbi:MAG: hypothetical protein AAF602_11585 [Myxococcota bacterium]